MKKETKEIVKLTVKEVLLTFVDIATLSASYNRIYRKSVNRYIKYRKYENENYWQKVSYLKRKGLIREFSEGKEHYFEITDDGEANIETDKLKRIELKRPNTWDGKWRMVIFDVPEKRRNERDAFRRRLTSWGFLQVQKSVYIYPFECSKEITKQSMHLGIQNSVTIAVSDIIQGEKEIIEKFINSGLLLEEDLIVKAK